MNRALKLAGWIDRLSRGVGHLASWLTLSMILLGAFNATARYLGKWTGLHLSANAWTEGQWYLFAMVFLLGAAATLEQDRHVRVDVLYGRLGPRGQALVDLLGTLLFLLPFCIFALVVSWPAVSSSWAIREGSPDPGGLPRYPIKALILVAFALLGLQGISQAIRALARLRSPPEPAP